jgi:hypothetical protein
MTRLENMTLFLKEFEWDAKREPFATVLWHLAQAERDFNEARAQRDALAMSYGELIAAVRVNAMRGTFREAAVEQVEEWIKPWVDKLAAVKGEMK